jgi:hypothetical protein
MEEKKPEVRGVPPARPFPSQIMHLLESTLLDTADAGRIIGIAPSTIEGWMIFRSKDAMPPAQWLLLNIYTLAAKNTCWPKENEDYIRDRFPNALPDDIKPKRKHPIPEGPPLPSADAIIDLLYDAGTTLDDTAFIPKRTADAWLGPDKRRMPYAVYELTVMTLWARRICPPTGEMAEYILQKYNGMFNPDR